MIFSLVLTAAFALLGLYTIVFFRGRLLGKSLLALYAGATICLWIPDASTWLANLIGIGRGVDFGLMLFSVISLNLTVFLIHHVHQLHRDVTLLARRFAIAEVMRQDPPADTAYDSRTRYTAADRQTILIDTSTNCGP